MYRVPYFNPYDFNHIWDLCVKTFNTFNGVINPIIKAGGIVVKPGYSGSITYLAYTNHNIVNIFIYNLRLCYDDPMIRDFSVVYTVLHELSHFEQDIDFERYAADMEYQEYIERANDNRTMGFILTHLKEVKIVLNQSSEDILLGLCKRMFPETGQAEFKYIGIVKFYWNILKYFLERSRSALPKLDQLIGDISLMDKLKDILLEFEDTATGQKEAFIMKENFKYNPDTFYINNLISRWVNGITYYLKSDITMTDTLLYVKFRISNKINYGFLPIE